MTAPGGAVTRVCVFSRILQPGMGDLVQRNVLFGLLRTAYPQARLTWVLGRHVAGVRATDELVRRHSLADDVLLCPDAEEDDPAAWARFMDELRERRFQVCVVDPASGGLGVREAAEAGIEVRVAVPGPWHDVRLAPREGAGRPRSRVVRLAGPALALLRMVPMLWRQCRGSDDELITHRMQPAGDSPDVYDYAVALAAALGVAAPPPERVVPRMPVVPEELPAWTRRRPLVGIAPGGAAGWNRRWPLAGFTGLAARLVAELDATVLVIGSAGEAGEAALLRDEVLRRRPEARVYASTGEPLNRVANLIDRLDLLVCNDSGPAHLAAALHTPTVVVYGPTGDEEWARSYPLHHAVNHRPPCQNRWSEYLGRDVQCAAGCRRAYGGPDGLYPACLAAVTVDEVWLAVLRRSQEKVGLHLGRDGRDGAAGQPVEPPVGAAVDAGDVAALDARVE